MTDEPSIMEIAMQMAMEELPMHENVDEDVLEGVKATLTSWVMSTFVEEQEIKEARLTSVDEPEEDSSDADLTNLIEQAIACAYVFARITDGDPTEARPHPPTGFTLSNSIVELLLRDGTVTLSLKID
jgi:hypothetical protein